VNLCSFRTVAMHIMTNRVGTQRSNATQAAAFQIRVQQPSQYCTDHTEQQVPTKTKRPRKTTAGTVAVHFERV
jgi:hypothetical protein